MKKDLRCPLGKSSNELVFVVYKELVAKLKVFLTIANCSCCTLGLHLRRKIEVSVEKIKQKTCDFNL